jgi:hypothetical protein
LCGRDQAGHLFYIHGIILRAAPDKCALAFEKACAKMVGIVQDGM